MRILGGGRSQNTDYIRVSDNFKHLGFTLTEILIATGIVGLIAALVLPSLVKNYQTKALAHGFTRQYQAIQSAVNSLVVNENKADFFTTSMYLNETPESYADSSGKFIKKYLKVNKYCGDNNGDCFAPKYYEFKDNDKVEYTPEFKGACASLKNGMSLCLTPQIGNDFIYGIIDVNGKKGPNIKDKDLRTFTISPKSRIGLNTDTQEVYVTSSDLKPDSGGSTTPTEPSKTACEIDEYSLDCCKTKTGSITSITDPCCNYSDIQDSVAICKDKGDIIVKLVPSRKGPNTWDIRVNIQGPTSMDLTKLEIYIQFAYFSSLTSNNILENDFRAFGIDLPFTSTTPKYKKAYIDLTDFPDNIRGPYPIECELVYNGEVLHYERMDKFGATSVTPDTWGDVSICKNFGGTYGD